MAKLTREEALSIARAAQAEWERMDPGLKGPVKDFFVKYGRQGIGYRPLCRVLFSNQSPEEAVRIPD